MAILVEPQKVWDSEAILTWQRLLQAIGILGAVASIVMAIDYFLFDSAIRDTLASPVTLPVWALVTCFITLLLVAALLGINSEKHGLSSDERKLLEDKVNTAHERVNALQSTNYRLRKALAEAEELDKQVIAILEGNELTLKEIANGLGLNYSDSKIRQRLLAVLGELIESGKVEKGRITGKYTRSFRDRIF